MADHSGPKDPATTLTHFYGSWREFYENMKAQRYAEYKEDLRKLEAFQPFYISFLPIVRKYNPGRPLTHHFAYHSSITVHLAENDSLKSIAESIVKELNEEFGSNQSHFDQFTPAFNISWRYKKHKAHSVPPSLTLKFIIPRTLQGDDLYIADVISFEETHTTTYTSREYELLNPEWVKAGFKE